MALALGAWEENTSRLGAVSPPAAHPSLLATPTPALPLLVLVATSVGEGEAAQRRLAAAMPGWRTEVLVVSGLASVGEARYGILSLEEAYRQGRLLDLRFVDVRGQ